MPSAPAEPAERELSSRAAVLAALLLVVLTLAAYLPALRAGYVWDDDDYVYENHLLWEPDGLRRIWFSADAPSQYFPLVYTTYRLEYALWGLDPFGYHLVNVLLHAANALLLWRLLAALKLPGGPIAAALFALHPVHVESVAWITERKNVLSGLMFLASLIAWVRHTDGTGPKGCPVGGSGAGRRSYWLSIGAYQLGLFAKTTVCILPAALVLSLWVRGRPVDRRRWLEIAPFVGLGIVAGVVAILWEQLHQGTTQRLAPGWPDVWIVASRAVWFYLEKLVLPLDLMFSYPKFAIDAHDPLHWLPLAALAALTAALWTLRARIGRAPIATLTYYVAALSPILGFVSLYTFLYTYVADHYQYLASFGPLALAGAGASRLLRSRRGVAVATAVALCAILASYGVLTWRQARVYHSHETLWADTAAKNPGSWMARHNLGEAYLHERRYDEAGEAFEAALAVKSDLDKTHRNLGIVRWRQGRLGEARRHFDEAIRIRPDFWNGQLTRAGFLLATHPQAAYHAYSHLTFLRPDRPEGHVGEARALARLGRRDEAERRLRLVVARLPGSPGPAIALADVLATCPRSPEAGAEALRIVEGIATAEGEGRPDAWAALAKARAATGDAEGARTAARRAADLGQDAGDPGLPAALRAEAAFWNDGAPWCPAPLPEPPPPVYPKMGPGLRPVPPPIR
jgi:tetratricopeptide (TPR) repeat protein